MNDDVASFYTHLRTSTAAMLGYADADNLAASQQIRLERAISLRLICDDTAARQMRGQPIDVRAFTDASESLEKMCGGDPEQAKGFDVDGNIAALEANIDGLLRAREQADAKQMADLMLREEMAAVIAAGVDISIAAVAPAAVVGRAQDDGGVHSPTATAPASPAVPLTVEQKMDRANNSRPPDRYLRQYDPVMEAWKASPWSRL